MNLAFPFCLTLAATLKYRESTHMQFQNDSRCSGAKPLKSHCPGTTFHCQLSSYSPQPALEGFHGDSLASVRRPARDRPRWRLRSLVVHRLGGRQ